MPFNNILTTPQYNKLHSGSYAGVVNVSFFSQRVVLAGQVNQDLTGSNRPWWQLNYNNVTAGDYTNVEDGMTLIIGTTNDLEYSAIHERLFHGRIRGLPSSSIITSNISSASVPNGAYFWVIDTFEAQNRLSRPTGELPNIIQLVDTTLEYENMMPRVFGLMSCYGGEKDPITGMFRLVLSVDSFVEQIGQTISSYQWVFRGSIATVVSGSLSSNAVTVDIDPSLCDTWGETWGTLNVTQSDGVVLVRKFGVKIHDATHPPDIHFDGINLAAAWGQNYMASLPAFAGVDHIFPGTPCLLWRSDEQYGSSSGGLIGDSSDGGNIEFYGWMVNEQDNLTGDKVYSTVSGATFQLAGVGARLAYLIEQLLMIINDSDPSLWDHIWFANIRRAIWHIISRHTTVGMLSDVNFDQQNLTEEFLFPRLPLKGNNPLSCCNNLLAQINGALEFAPDGRIFGCRDAQYLDDIFFAYVPVIAGFTGQDGFVVGLNVDYNNAIGVVDAVGAAWNSPSNSVQAFKSRAPGLSQGESQGTAPLNDQILIAGSDVNVAQAELNQRSGTYYAIQNMTEELTIDFPDGYFFLIPSKSELYTWTLDTTLAGPSGVSRIIYDTSTKWFVKSVKYMPANDGTRKNRVTFKKIVRGAAPGQTPPATPDTNVTIPPLQPPSFPSLPGLPPIPEAGLPNLPPGYKPPKGKITHLDGETVIINNDSQAWITQTYIALASPTWRGITPSDIGAFQIQEVLFDPFGPSTNTCGVYLLASDGTDSAIWYTANALVSPPVWTKGAVFSGVYTQIRAANVAGSVLVYTGDSSATTVPYDLLATDGGLVNTVESGQTPTTDGTWVHLQGWIPTLITVISSSETVNAVDIDLTFMSPVSVYTAQMTYDITKGLFSTSGANNAIVFFNGASQVGIAAALSDTDPDGTGKILAIPSSSYTVDRIHLQIRTCSRTAAGSNGNGAITKLVVSMSGGSNGGVRLSDDYGSTVGSAIDLGSSPGQAGGFDLIRSGGVSYGAGANSLLKATTLGGTYSAFATLSANAISACIPYYQVGSNSIAQTTSSNPQVVIGYAAAVSGSCIAWIDGSGTITPITNPVSGAFFDLPNCITMLRGTKVAIIVNVSGTRKLYVTENLAADGSCTWTFIKNVGSLATLRTRRNDASKGSHKGQLFVFDDPCGYSSKFASAGEFNRASPGSGISAGDIYN